MSDHDSLAPLLGSLTSAFAKSRRPGAPQTGSVDRALGAAASLGLSLAILRLVVFCAKAAKRLESSSDDPNQFQLASPESAGNVWYSFMRNLIRRLLQEDSHTDSKGSTGIEGDGGAIITHQGSCHCESVHFEVRERGVSRSSSIVGCSILPFLYAPFSFFFFDSQVLAPRCLCAKDGPGKIQYRHTQVKAANFRVTKGKDCLKTYYVLPKDSTHNSKGAHAFCGRCGVHILYAPSKNSSRLEINVHCLEDGIRKLRVTSSTDAISNTIPVEGQWDDQLTTISEVGSDETSRFMFELSDAPFIIATPGSSSPTTTSASQSQWMLHRKSEDSSLGSMFFEEKPFAFTPETPSTIDSVTAADSYVSSILRADSVATETESTTSTTTETNNRASAAISLECPPPKSKTTSPPTAQSRDQMRYYMKKHLGTQKVSEEEKKTSQ
jgi:hypothetical protein